MNKENIIDILKTVYDPEVPILDIWNMGLVYDVKVDWNKVDLLITFTSPACPMWDMIVEMIKNSIQEKYPESVVEVETTFEPNWSPEMIKDEEIREMFMMQ